MDFETRYKKLNDRQKEAVDTIEGPVMVVAGPGTGKTELLSMRAANILDKTDADPDNILLLTFTDSGANSMRTRLNQIIGPTSNRIAVHTFHSFASDVITNHSEYFYSGASFSLADDIAKYQLLVEILDELEHTNPLASKLNGVYTQIGNIQTAISELKSSGLTGDELVAALDGNDAAIDALEPKALEVLDKRLSTKDFTAIEELWIHASNLNIPTMPGELLSLTTVFTRSLRQALDAAGEVNKPKPLNDWRKEWLVGTEGNRTFKVRQQQTKLRALAQVYTTFTYRMQSRGLYDFDDMLLNLVLALEQQPDLKAELQEKFQYVMVDEFQDTNLAQMRILHLLAEIPTGDAPNILTVGDDDQAIYSFQGAEVKNILNFADEYAETKHIVLRDNYRSGNTILELARSIIIQADGRLEHRYEHIDKSLTANVEDADVSLHENPTETDEQAYIAEQIAAQIKSGASPKDIAVIARKHSQLVALVPHLAAKDIPVNYEKRSNVLDIEPIVLIEDIAQLAVLLSQNKHDQANARLPQIIAHPAFGINPVDIYSLSIRAYENRQRWLDQMLVTPELKAVAEWLITLSTHSKTMSLEQIIDAIIGRSSLDATSYVSPLYEHFFSRDKLEQNPDTYIEYIEALRTLRTKLQEHQPGQTLKLADLIAYTDLIRDLGITITNVHKPAENTQAVNLLTAHKSKGMEFATVYVIAANENVWGVKARGRGGSISYPVNMPLKRNSNSYDERLRLFFVALTRAKRELHISYHTLDDSGKEQIGAGFLASETLPASKTTAATSKEAQTRNADIAWYGELVKPTRELKEVLQPILERYKLSATHLNAFTSLDYGGPNEFLLGNLLKFPDAPKPELAFGNAIHNALQRAHTHYVAKGAHKALEDVIADFERALLDQQLPSSDYAKLQERGAEVLANFIPQHQDTFTPDDKAELNMAGQNVVLTDAKLTGKLDLVRIDKTARTITVIDYKTGTPLASLDHKKAKAHRYKQQLIFYKLLIENSSDYSNYTVDRGIIQFVEPDKTTGEIVTLEMTFDPEEVEHTTKLINAVWHKIVHLELPDTSRYGDTLDDIRQFESDLITGTV